MTGQQILEDIAAQDFRVVIARKAMEQGQGSPERVEQAQAEALARLSGTVDQATVEQWIADAGEATPEQRAKVTYNLRRDLIAGRIPAGVSRATMAAIIDALEA